MENITSALRGCTAEKPRTRWEEEVQKKKGGMESKVRKNDWNEPENEGE